MSGICGVYYLDGRPAGRAILESMLASIRHRGQDGTGIWSQGSVGLAQCMRWSSREYRHERQPMLSSQADLVLVADARIDNRNDLINSFVMRDIPANEISNGHLILKAYQTWGEACPEKLEGDFAFAIWDARRKYLFCVRDAAGVKPFYYFSSPHLFAFASEIKALLTIPGLPRCLNERKVADFLLWSFEDTQDTFYQNIHRLPPASSLLVGMDEKRQRRYWSLDPGRELRLESEEAYISSFREIFNDAVRCRVNGAAVPASTLSGGLDSSSIACTARRYLAQRNNLPLNVFSVVFGENLQASWAGIDEKVYIQEVLSMGGFEGHTVDASQYSPLIDGERLYSALDEPYFAPTLYLFWGLLHAAQEVGVSVLLDGTDGDRTIFHGEQYLTDLARRWQWREFYRQASALAKVQHGSTDIRPLAWRYGIRPFIPSALVNIGRQARKNNNQEAADGWIIRPEFARRAGYPDFPKEVMSNSSASRVLSSREIHWQELSSGMNALSLELFDKAAGAFSLEMRFPFYDRRLMEFCLAVPGELKLSQGWTRYILRASMRETLPESIRWRKGKANLFQAFTQQFALIGKEKLDPLLNEASRVLMPYVDNLRLVNIYNEFCEQPLSRTANAYTIYGAIILAGWLQSTGFG